MAITYLPSEIARKVAPKKLVERLVTKDLTLNRATVNMLSESGVLSKKAVEKVAIKVIKDYKKAYKKEIKEGATKTEALEDVLNGKRQMVQRIQNASVQEVTSEVKKVYRGERYEWLPSSAEVADPLHQLNYGKRFWLGKGEAPGDRPGCRCGMRILVDEDELFLEDEIAI
jgi:hypothetical protein